MLTISIMARFGLWTLLRVEDKSPDKIKWEHCERCDRHIRYVHVCQVDGETKAWRIGSECGPTLVRVSEEIWGKVTATADRDLLLLHRTLRLRPLEAGPNPWGKHLGPDWVDRFATCLERRETDNYDLCAGNLRAIQNLKYIQTRLQLAEKHHGLKPFRRGIGI
ncbi:hypothetical protein [Sorangium sp. So ce1153]|uniref:hypothetical protein n=1 Tax=Sorangium sp. So ce1153 TaxID=3133333 RepID=UPI003F62394F